MAIDRYGSLSALWVIVPLVFLLLLNGPLSCMAALPPFSPPAGLQTGSPHPTLLDVKAHFSGKCVLCSIIPSQSKTTKGEAQES